jgi:colicin import membrane protein
VARLNSVRITVIGLIIVVALALGAWTRLTIAMASGAAASRVSAGSPTTSALAMTNVAASKGTKPAKTDAKSTTSASTTKAASAAPTASSTATSSATTSDSSPQQIAQSMLSSYGWDSGQWTYLYQLWEKESGWSVTATNPGSGAYGIAQANPASQMDSVGSDWQTDATTQIKWGLEYIKDRYGSPAAAWAHETADGWY